MVNVTVKAIPSSATVHIEDCNSVSVLATGNAYSTGGEYYSGTYVVEPDIDSIILRTKNHLMSDDVTINGVRYSSTTNTSGGNTVYIGG